MDLRSTLALLKIISGILVLSGCGTLPNGRGWGEDAVVPLPSLERVGRAALRAAINPMTWAPAIGASLFVIDDFDHKVSRWAIENTPIFGSTSTASQASTDLLWASAGGAVITTIATPSGDQTGDWLLGKGKGLLVEGTGVGATLGVTEVLKRTVDRTRPTNLNSQQSFPSGHAAAAFSLATLTSKDLDSISLPPALRIGLQAGAYTVAGGTAWARVEAGKHFPSDVLAGAALGHFLTAFIHDAFLGLPLDDSMTVEVGSVGRETLVSIGFSF